jgi:hypothetical protein
MMWREGGGWGMEGEGMAGGLQLQLSQISIGDIPPSLYVYCSILHTPCTAQYVRVCTALYVYQRCIVLSRVCLCRHIYCMSPI